MDEDFQTDFCNELNIALESVLCTEVEEAVTVADIIVPHADSVQSEFEESNVTDDIASHIERVHSEFASHETLQQLHTLTGVLEVLQGKTDYISGNLQNSVEEFELSVLHLHSPHRHVEAVRMCYTRGHRQHIMHLLDDVELRWMTEMDSTGAFKDGYRIDAQVAHDVIGKYTKSNEGEFPEWIGVLKVDGDLSLRSMPNPSGKSRILPESFACIVVNGSIDVSNNQINDLPFHLSNLYIENNLDLSNNELVHFQLSNDLYIPGNLDLSNNKFTCLPDDFSKYAVIVGDLGLSYNRDLQISAELLGLAVQGRVVTEGVFINTNDAIDLVDTFVIMDGIMCKNTLLKESVDFLGSTSI